MRWATGLLLVVTGLCFLSWVFYLAWFGITLPKEKNPVVMKVMIVVSCVLFKVFVGLFIVIIIFISMSEISQRRAKCQVLNVGSMLINGYTNDQNGNNYVGLVTISNALTGLYSEFQNLKTVTLASQSILSSNIPFWTNATSNSLVTFYQNNYQKTTIGSLSEVSVGNVIASLTPTITPYIGAEFKRLKDTSTTFIAAAQAVSDLSNTVSTTIVQQTINQMNYTMASMINDLSDTTLSIWNNGWNRYMYASGGFWSIFAISIVIIGAISIMIVNLRGSWNNSNIESKLSTFKIILAVVGFFAVWYGVLTIILLAGSTSIATFCTVLTELNKENTEPIDSLPLTWQTNPFGLSKQILKECTVGKRGNLFDFIGTNPVSDTFSSLLANDVQNLIIGLSAYNAWTSNLLMNNGSSTINFLIANMTLVSQGVIEDNTGVIDQSLILNQYLQSSNVNNSLTAYLCPSMSPTNNCLNDDKVNSILSISNSTNLVVATPLYQNLQNYIISEQNVINSMISELSNGNQSPNYKFTTTNLLLFQNQANYNSIVQALPLTTAFMSKYPAGLSSFDCRNLRYELLILEDHLCFKLSFTVYILTILSSVSLVILLFLMWTLFAAARYSEAENAISAMPQSANKEREVLNINDSEVIPGV
jgi:hypothetical protein